jgi:hypothetical protein
MGLREGDWGRDGSQRGFWVRGQSITALDWCGRKFASLHKEPPPQARALKKTVLPHLLIILCIYCKYAPMLFIWFLSAG